MSKITGEDVRRAMVAGDICRVEVRDCTLCGYTLAYLRSGERLFFDAGCHCTARSSVRSRRWDEAAEFIELQRSPELRAKLLAAFGLPSGESLDG